MTRSVIAVDQWSDS